MADFPTTSPSRLRVWFSSRLGYVAAQMMLLVALHTLLRLGLSLRFGKEAGSSAEWGAVFLVGAHLDLVVAFVVMAPLWTWVLLAPERWARRPASRWAFYAANALFWGVMIFLLAAEYFFFEEFRSRFNTVAIDYLLYPHEVFTNVWESYPVPGVLAACLIGACSIVWGARRTARHFIDMPLGARLRRRYLIGGMAATALLVASVSLRETRFSKERLWNELASNGLVSGLSAAWSRNLDYAAFYATLPMDQAVSRARRLLSEKGSEFGSLDQPLVRRVAGDPARPRRNVVILLEESLGSEFWGCLGRPGESLTPEMDRLAAREGILFENLYATGNRTVRGFEGVLSSFVPLPGDSIVRRDRSENVESVARVMKRDGYQTLFLYGGRGVFDGMRSYAVRNGYDRFVEQKDFLKPTFTTVWGVCNEDLYQRTLDELRALHQAGAPYFVTALSVSNHKPFTYPAGRIAEDPEARRRENAVKYTDWALGRFFEAARKEAFWNDTIFVVVADHGARVYGSQTIPIHSYEIPMVILGGSVAGAPRRVGTLGCQLDVAPTLLGMVGRPYTSMFFGKDLFRESESGRIVLLNHNRSVGAYRDERLVILGLNKTLEFYHGDPKKTQMVRIDQPEPQDRELQLDAIAMFQIADDLYMHRRFALDVPPGTPAVVPGAAAGSARRDPR